MFGVHVYVRGLGGSHWNQSRGQGAHVPVVPGTGDTRMSGLTCQQREWDLGSQDPCVHGAAPGVREGGSGCQLLDGVVGLEGPE